ncbi:MAG: radical SAM protein [Acidaminococcaceae bacterium]|nr:radical SAM protein [Acidaminococcaceae bacterium]
MFFDSYDTPVFRPPSEANSFILRVTRGCAHNKCTYCNMYRGVPFQILKDEEISKQIALGVYYGKEQVRRVFLADGDALVLPTEKLLKILQALRENFPKLQRVSSYAAPKDILRKSEEELRQLKEAGLQLLYYGMETGDDITLKAVNKGVNAEEAVEAGRRVKAGGMKLSVMVILGIAGVEGSRRHALATAEAINIIKPDMLSALCLMLYRGSELKQQFEEGNFHPPSPAGLMEELQLMLEHIDLPQADHCLFRSNHISNYVQLAGTLPQDKERLLREVAASVAHLSKLKSWDVYNNTEY